jgi:hypothetical protein
VVCFRPDEFNRAYVQPTQDRWWVVSDFAASGPLAAGTVGFSTKIRECEMVAVGTEEFIVGPSGLVRQDQIGPHVTPPATIRVPSARASLTALLTQAYTTNRGRGLNPPTYVLPRP